jgi:hypothetical protein
MSKLDAEMMEKYGIKYLTLFIHKGVTELFYQSRLPQVEQKTVEEAQRKKMHMYLLNGKNDENRKTLMSEHEEGKLSMRLK